MASGKQKRVLFEHVPEGMLRTLDMNGEYNIKIYKTN